MSKIGFYISVLFTVLVIIDYASTILVFSLQPQLPDTLLVEQNPLGYPLCLINIILNPTPFLLASYGILRVKNQTVTWMLTWLLIGFLIPYCYGSLKAAVNNLVLYDRLLVQIEKN